MKIHVAILAAALGGLSPWLANAAADTATAQQPAAVTGYTDGEVKKIDTEQSKVTLKHGPIDNLGMPGMTMVFRADPAVLTQLKAGDLIRFKVDRVEGSLKVTELVVR